MRRVPWRKIGTALALLAALGFVFSVQYIPHLATFGNPPPGDEPGLLQHGQAWANYVRGYREGFPWSIHVDEHFHASVVSEVQRVDRVIPWDPYEAEHGEFDPMQQGLKGGIHERGYHIFLAQIGEVTGVSTLHLYQFLPAAWMAFTAFAVWALVRPHPAAIPAAAFVALVPTTVRFLGTGFLVPIGFSLAWLPVTAILTEPAKRRAASAALLLGVVTWAFFVHLVAGFAAVAIVLGAGLFSSGRGRRAALTLFLLALVPVAWLYRSFSAGVQSQIEREATLPIDFTIFDNFGVITLAIWAFGVALYWLDPPADEDSRPAVAAFASLSLVALGLIVASVVFDLNRYATYSRMHPIFFLTAAVPAGYAVGTVGSRVGQAIEAGWGWVTDRSQGGGAPGFVRPTIAVVVAGAMMVPATSQAVGYHLEEGYYRVMTEDVWDAYEEVDREHAAQGSPYEVFLSHPWRSPFLFEMTGKMPHTIMRPGGSPAKAADWLGYLQGQRDLAFYVMNDITLVVGDRPPPGDVWERSSNTSMVWTMEEPYAEQIQRIRAGKGLQLGALPEQG